MAQNMYCSDHKVSNEKYRDGYDKIEWSNKKKEDNENSSNTTDIQR